MKIHEKILERERYLPVAIVTKNKRSEDLLKRKILVAIVTKICTITISEHLCKVHTKKKYFFLWQLVEIVTKCLQN